LAAVIVDIQAAQDLAQRVKPARPQPPVNRAAKRAIKSHEGVITAVIVAAFTLSVAVGQPGEAVILAVFIMALIAVATAFVASVAAAVVEFELHPQLQQSDRR
jgi:hypothetical protein